MPSGSIEVNRAWKRFRRGRLHDSLRDLVPDLVRSLLGRSSPTALDREEFWAVKDVSFRVGPGETLGIIGHNGAGKSTVLKLLTKVVHPTLGQCRVVGRVGALVEIAAGFHPDLTGRENVHLQGAIMGMSKADIARKFSDIVEFSGIREFIDTPVKRYSSGMHARLGFSIAAHLDPDVLIIDEILSVGDLNFQEQAFGRIKALATSGRPVVIVSHQLPRIEELCTRAIVLDHGGVMFDGSPKAAVTTYTLGGASPGATMATEGAPVTIDAVTVDRGDLVRSGDEVRLNISGNVVRADLEEHIEPVAVLVRNAENGTIVSIVGTRDCNLQLSETGAFGIDVSLQMNVMPGLYLVQVVGWDKVRQSTFAAGPSVSVLVQQGPRFLGFIQLNASMTLTTNQGKSVPDVP